MYQCSACDLGMSWMPTSYSVGTIYITMRNPKTDRVLWRGVASSVLAENAAPEKRAQRLDEAIEKLLANFPPTHKPVH